MTTGGLVRTGGGGSYVPCHRVQSGCICPSYREPVVMSKSVQTALDNHHYVYCTLLETLVQTSVRLSATDAFCYEIRPTVV